MARPRRFTSTSSSRQLWALSPYAHLEADQLLPALRRGADEDQHALSLVLHPGLQVDPVGPDVDVVSGRQVPPLPALVLGLPFGREAHHDRGRQVRGVLAQKRRQSFLEVAGRDAAQVQRRQQGIEAARPPRPARQDCRAESDALATFVGPAVPDLGAGYRDGADPGLHLAFGAVPMPDEARPTIGKLQTRSLGQESLDFQLDSLGQKLAGAGPQYLRQWIIGVIGLTKPHDVAILIHGVSLSPERFWQAWTPASIRRLSQAIVTQFPA